jgi:nucleosome binding factor SPN SPT16 subunit
MESETQAMFTLHHGIADKSAANFRFQEISCFLLWHILLGELRFISCRYLSGAWQELEQATGNERPDEDDEEDESEEEVIDEDDEDDDDDDDDEEDFVSM